MSSNIKIYFEENAPDVESLLLISFLVATCDQVYYNITLSDLKIHNYDCYEMIKKKEKRAKSQKRTKISPDYNIILRRNNWSNKKLIEILRKC